MVEESKTTENQGSRPVGANGFGAGNLNITQYQLIQDIPDEAFDLPVSLSATAGFIPGELFAPVEPIEPVIEPIEPIIGPKTDTPIEPIP